jgi:hypothetical protein
MEAAKARARAARYFMMVMDVGNADGARKDVAGVGDAKRGSSGDTNKTGLDRIESDEGVCCREERARVRGGRWWNGG